MLVFGNINADVGHGISLLDIVLMLLDPQASYDFRTTFATQAKERGQTSAQVADLLGHKDTRMVETIYARTRHQSVMKQLDVIERLNG